MDMEGVILTERYVAVRYGRERSNVPGLAGQQEVNGA